MHRTKFSAISAVLLVTLALASAAFAQVPRNRWAPFGPGGSSRGPIALFEIHPLRPDTFYLGLASGEDRVFRSTDHGRTWEEFAHQIAQDGLLDLAFDPTDPDVLYAINEEGLWKSRDGGEAWERLDAASFYRIAVSAPGTLLAGRDCGLSRSMDGGKTWKTVIPCFTGDDLTVFTIDLRVDPDDPRSLYALMVATNGASGFDQFLARSTDGGATWKNLEISISAFAVAPSDFQTLYAIELRTGKLLRSRDGGESWRTVHSRLPYPDAYTSLAVNAADPDTLYVGTAQKGVLRSRNGGVTLKPLGALVAVSRRQVRSLLTDHNQPGIVWAVLLNGGLFAGRFE